MDDRTISSVRNSDLATKEIEKYIKFFVIKSLQAVVLSRIGVRNKTKCNPTAKGLDWFNISLADCDANRKLQTKIRELSGKKVPTLIHPFCLDIILKTCEGNFIVLETWQLSTDTQCTNSKSKHHNSVYTQFGTLLKSVITMARVLPSFNLSKKSESSDFTMFFKVHTELYALHHFELHNSISIGSVNTPSGRLNIKVMYRNKIWLSGSLHAYTYSITDPETLYPLFSEKDKAKSSFQSVETVENELAIAASDTGTGLSDWFSSELSSTSSDMTNITSPGKNTYGVTSDGNTFSCASIGVVEDGLRPIAAFAEPVKIEESSLSAMDFPKLPSTPPFQSLFQEDTICEADDNQSENVNLPPEQSNNKLTKPISENPVTSRRAEAVGFEDDFVLVELRPAFFSDDSVGNLYRQCKSPSPLDIFSALENEDKESESIDLDTQLENYRKELEEYKDFFKIMT